MGRVQLLGHFHSFASILKSPLDEKIKIPPPFDTSDVHHEVYTILVASAYLNIVKIYLETGHVITNMRLVTAIKGGQFPKAKVSPMFIDIK